MAAAAAISDQARRHHAAQPEAQDQRAGEEARRIHADHMPLDAERGLADRMIAHHHGKRRRGHQQIHHRIARKPAGRRYDEARLAHDLAERPPGGEAAHRRRLRDFRNTSTTAASSAHADCAR